MVFRNFIYLHNEKHVQNNQVTIKTKEIHILTLISNYNKLSPIIYIHKLQFIYRIFEQIVKA